MQLERLPPRLDVAGPRAEAKRIEGSRRARKVARHPGGVEVAQPEPRRLGQRDARTEVDDAETRTGLQQEVAGMRVGVDEPVDQDLLEEGVDEDAERLLGLRPVDLPQRVTEVAPLDPIHHQHAAAGERRHDARHLDAGFVGEVGAEPFDVGGLVAVVELRQDRPFELTGDRRQIDTAHKAGDEPQDARRILGLARDDLGNARILHLDRHQPAIVETGAVHLGE